MIVGLPQRDILLAVVIAILHLLPIQVTQRKQGWQSATLDFGALTPTVANICPKLRAGSASLLARARAHLEYRRARLW